MKNYSRIIEAMDFESDDQNFKYEFKVMSKRYGGAFIEFIKSSWKANDGVQTEEEFCVMNANIPIGFFKKITGS